MNAAQINFYLFSKYVQCQKSSSFFTFNSMDPQLYVTFKRDDVFNASKIFYLFLV